MELENIMNKFQNISKRSLKHSQHIPKTSLKHHKHNYHKHIAETSPIHRKNIAKKPPRPIFFLPRSGCPSTRAGRGLDACVLVAVWRVTWPRTCLRQTTGARTAIALGAEHGAPGVFLLARLEPNAVPLFAAQVGDALRVRVRESPRGRALPGTGEEA